METKTRVLIADTNDDFKRLMTEVLRNEEDLELVGCVGDLVIWTVVSAAFGVFFIVGAIVMKKPKGD